ncbi:hypothetical protein [Nitratidesulfovibrio sp. SRB-5]|uniref:hypothetical protein n=1 Tax=Nitratidesulfovibrio sp. SRB-5 TaxID=2872636 RepID=UPI0010271C9F|nr:hypothetical protein [Nitratidesulfovibrio sp. SRB-5]MBZ2172788.1 hypothetical protein [Nitratidesulfovibrio sp. SRB-5]RXF73822.1 hypothetical protein EKK70_16945 [Desulfovibrio sp. DS-1]
MAASDAKKLKKRIAEIRRRKAERKMDPFSQLIHDFCRPLLAVAEELSGPENAVSLGVFAWNAAFLPDERWQANLRLSLVRFDLTDDAQEALEGIVEEMIRQKRLMFPDDRRVVTRFDVTARDGKVFVEAAQRTATKELMPHLRPEYAVTTPGAPSATHDGDTGCSGCPSSGTDVAGGCPSATAGGACPSLMQPGSLLPGQGTPLTTTEAASVASPADNADDAHDEPCPKD